MSLARLDEPMTALRGLRDLVVIDEIQKRTGEHARRRPVPTSAFMITVDSGYALTERTAAQLIRRPEQLDAAVTVPRGRIKSPR